jgi:predicted MFS family arabinose efflux permease
VLRDLAEFKTGWPVVLSALLGIGLGLSPVPFYTIGVLAPELAREFGWGFGQILAGLSVMTFTVLAASPIIGLLADRYGVRLVVLVSVVCFSLAFMSFGLNQGSLIQFYLTWALAAIAGAGTLPVTWTRAVNSVFEKRKGLALGLSLLGTGLFGYLVKPYTAWLIDSFGWRVAYFAIGALPLLIAFPVAWLCFFERRNTVAELNLATEHELPQVLGQSFALAIRDWRFWVLAAAFVPISFAVGGPIPNMENILKKAGFDHTDIIGLVQWIGISVIFGRVIGGWLIDRFWAPAVAFLLLSAPILSCWLLAQSDITFFSANLAIVTIGFAAGVEYDLMAFLVARYFGMKSYSAIYGALYGFFALGAGIGPLAFGAAFDRTGSYNQPLMISAGLLLIGAVLLLTLGRYRRFEPNSP